MKQESFDPGLTTQFSGVLRRTINADGSFNVRRKGLRWQDANLYLKLIDTTWPRFFLVVLVIFLAVNLLFAGAYWALGIEHLRGSDAGLTAFAKAFFFSVHTLTTVGYGDVFPEGNLANGVSAVEAASGLMIFAVLTGLLYGRFSRPTARILFSNNALIAPYQDGTSFQFRITNARSNVLMNVEARVLLMTVESISGELRRNFVDLPLERRNVYFFPLTWSIVHPIDSASPLYGKTREDLAQRSVEFLILIQGFDDTFSQQVHAVFSYRHDQIVWGAKFAPAFSVDSKGDLVLEVDRIHELTLVGDGNAIQS